MGKDLLDLPQNNKKKIILAVIGFFTVAIVVAGFVLVLQSQLQSRQVESVITNQITNLTEFPVESSTLASTYRAELDKLQVTKEKSIKALYFTDFQFMASEVVEAVSIKFGWTFRNINSRAFRSYYEGNFTIENQGVYAFEASVSWAQVKIFIAERLVFHIDNTFERKRLALNPGNYTYRLEYVNYWHTTKFQFSKLPDYTALTLSAAVEKAKLHSQNAKFWSGFINESSDTYSKVDVTFNGNGEDAILILGSTDSVRWKVSGAGVEKIKAIIVCSFNPSTTIDAEEGIPVYRVNERVLNLNFEIYHKVNFESTNVIAF